MEQRETQFRLKKKLEEIKSFEQNKSESTNGNWHDVRKYSGENATLSSKDMKPAETTVAFVSSIVDKVSSFVSELKDRKGNIFKAAHTAVKPHKVNKLLFLKQILKQEKLF